MDEGPEANLRRAPSTRETSAVAHGPRGTFHSLAYGCADKLSMSSEGRYFTNLDDGYQLQWARLPMLARGKDAALRVNSVVGRDGLRPVQSAAQQRGPTAGDSRQGRLPGKNHRVVISARRIARMPGGMIFVSVGKS